MHYIPLIFFLTSLIFSPTISTNILNGVTLELTHVDYGRQLTKFEHLKICALRSQIRTAYLTTRLFPNSKNPYNQANIPFHPSGAYEYVLEFSMGTPPQPYTFILDTGSDLIWTQCKPCKQCMKQPAPLFEPTKSSTFSLLPCSNKMCQDLQDREQCISNQCIYSYSYGDSTYSYGPLSREIFTLGTTNKVKMPFTFGCGIQNGGDLNNASGIAGFGRASYSFVSQLGVPGFSYCMTDNINKKSPLKFGSQAEIYSNIFAPVQTTPFIPAFSQDYSTVYFVSMTGITVGTTWLKIPRSVFANGTIVDSGTAFTQMPEAAYNEFREAFLSIVKLPFSKESPEGLECFSSKKIRPSRVKVPNVIFHFQGMDMHLPRKNYVMDLDKKGLMCLTMQMTSDLFILGNEQQKNMQVMYDLANNRLAIAPTQCDKQ
ncbi:hypothetical protein LUZ60_002762 [Juncus effusus]|nr:hypothetical protein LUZ60_002762 [Juncus effusus]